MMGATCRVPPLLATLVVVASIGLLASCFRAARPTTDVDLAHAADRVATDIARQLGPATSAARTIVIDPVLDGRSGQQTHASERAQEVLGVSLGRTVFRAKLLAFDTAGTNDARYVVTGTLTELPDADQYRLSAALLDRQTGIVVAQSAAGFRQPGLDTSPTQFYADSPSLVRDRSIEGYLRTTETARGEAADALYIEQLPTSALLAEALTAYNEERWQDSLTRYETAVKRADGQQLRTFNGIYLCNIHLNNIAAAEQAFAKIVVLGLETNNLAVKLLFRPAGTDFWPDPKITRHYPMWLREIARGAMASGRCLDVVGHTSHSGTEAVNIPLSRARAITIRDRLDAEAPGLGKKTRVDGVGFRENIVGTGTDDASDAIDRRVEFKVIACDGEQLSAR